MREIVWFGDSLYFKKTNIKKQNKKIIIIKFVGVTFPADIAREKLWFSCTCCVFAQL